MKKIAILIPSRDRNHKIERLNNLWFEYIDNSIITDCIIVLDEDNEHTYTRMPGFIYHIVKSNGSRGIVYPLNQAANTFCNEYEYIGFWGDDHRPNTKNWNSIMYSTLNDNKPYSMVYGNDLLQGENLPTEIIIDSLYIKKFGYMIHPSIQHLYSDDLLLYMGKYMNNIHYLKDVIIEHEHYMVGKSAPDAMYYAVNGHIILEKDKAAYETIKNSAEFNNKLDELLYETKINYLIENSDKSTLEKDIQDFLLLYSKKPIKDNSGGMKAQHMFWVYYILKKINPKVIIESGIWYGQSSWLIEQVCPNSKIISIDPELDRIIYKSKNIEYRRKDFNDHDFTSELGDDCKNTLAFIDDHQNNYLRLKHAFKHNIRHLIFEDNYPTTHGDVLSLKKILDNKFYVIDDANHGKSIHDIPSNYKTDVLEMCDYTECPPLYLDTNITRWGDRFSDHNCKKPIYNNYEEWLDEFKKEQLDYTFIAYVNVKPNKNK
jgi:hypothetical protein